MKTLLSLFFLTALALTAADKPAGTYPRQSSLSGGNVLWGVTKQDSSGDPFLIAPSDLIAALMQVNGLKLTAFDTNSPPANTFFFAGDSLIAHQFANVNEGQEWPAFVLAQPNYYFNGGAVNNGVGNTTSSNWNGTLYAANVTPYITGMSNCICFYQGFVNDITAGFDSPVILSNLTQICSKIRADGAQAALITQYPLTGWSAGQSNVCATVNAAISNMVPATCDYMLDITRIVTNSVLQTIEGVHMKFATVKSWAQFVNTNLVPPLSGQWGGRIRPSPYLYTGGILNTGTLYTSALSVNGLGTPNIGQSIEMLYDQGTFQGVIQPWNRDNGTPSMLNVRASKIQLVLQPGGTGIILQSNSVFNIYTSTNLLLVAGTAGFSNTVSIYSGGMFLGSSFITSGSGAPGGTPTDGSLYLRTDIGTLYLRTNSTWIIK